MTITMMKVRWSGHYYSYSKLSLVIVLGVNGP